MRGVSGVGLLALAAVLFAVPVRLALPPPAGARADVRPDPRIVGHLRGLDAGLGRGEASRMQRLFPEGFVFTHALVGLSWARVAAMDAGLRDEALGHARASLAAIRSREGRRPFPSDQSPPGGAFHAGWGAYLAGQIVAASRDPAEARAFAADCVRLAAALDRTPFPPSYPGAAWPADASVGVAALALHDRLFAPRTSAGDGAAYGPTIQRWVAGVRARLDPETGLVSHAADATTGTAQGGARGESLVLTLRFLAEIDPAFAREQYGRFRERFVSTRYGLPVVLAYPAGYRGAADVDSGPVIWGVGLPATVVGLGAARAVGDAALAAPLDRELEALGMPVVWGGRRSYGFGALAVGEAFLVWARLTPAAPDAGFAPVVGAAWGMPVAATSGLLGVLLLLLARRVLWPRSTSVPETSRASASTRS